MRSDDLHLPGDIAILRTFYALIAALVATFGAIVWTLFDRSDNIVTSAVIAKRKGARVFVWVRMRPPQRVIGLPPSDAGADQVSSTWPSPGVAVTFVGAP